MLLNFAIAGAPRSFLALPPGASNAVSMVPICFPDCRRQETIVREHSICTSSLARSIAVGMKPSTPALVAHDKWVEPLIGLATDDLQHQ
jgi:hypothetical protein